jgi:phosphoglycolate phosphatase-like HAD superfamily hydrolase
MQRTKSVLITDLDNTLFDWVELWYNCFSAMLEQIAAIGGIPKDQLIPEIAAVHQKHGTSEYSFLLEELPSVQRILKGRRAVEVFSPAIEIYRQKRTSFLRLYPTVAETILKIKGRGTMIIAYTESMAFYSNYRLRRLGLDGVIDALFSPSDHVLPKSLSSEEFRKYPSQHYQFRYTRQYFTPEGSKKPDPDVLTSILKQLNLNKDDCIYVGDSLMKDVAMALDCGIDDAWAQYGTAHKRPEYQLLRDVTHWTAEEVERERMINEREHVKPTLALSKSFSELLDAINFVDHH